MSLARFHALALCDRAYALLASGEPVAEETLLAHVYSGALPAAVRAQLAAPLLEDPRLERQPDGRWSIVGPRPKPRPEGEGLRELAFTTLAVLATGPNPERGRVVQVSALHIHRGKTVERFSSTVNPGKRVPRYVAERLGLAPAELDDLPPFATVLDDLVHFLGSRPVVVQDARLTWAFVEAEARRLGRALADRLLIDANQLATHLLDLSGKPNLARVAAQLEIGMHHPPRPDEEARVLALVSARLLDSAAARGFRGLELALEARASTGQPALRRRATVEALADAPGVYVMRDLDQTPLYVGKARRLRLRLAAYVNRPIGATRRLEGLVSAVEQVDSTECATDLEALILEDREIRRLVPRFNTVRQQRPPRLWIRRPPTPEPRPGKRHLAPPRLELSLGPPAGHGARTTLGTGVVDNTATNLRRWIRDDDGEGGDSGDFVGPFRNESLADQARGLARRVFALDALRRDNPAEYATQLNRAWLFLRGDVATALELARRASSTLARQVLDFDLANAQLPADPRRSNYVVLRPGLTGIEGFRIDQGILRAWVPPRLDDDPEQLAAELLADAPARTTPDDVDVVLRWFGAQRPPTCLVHLPDDPLAAAEAIEAAALALVFGLEQARSTHVENALEPLT